MDIWILVLVLLVIAVVLLVASFFTDDEEDFDLDERFNEYALQQSQELLNLKNRVTDLETYLYQDPENYTTETAVDFVEDRELQAEAVSEPVRQEIIDLYSKGYRLDEIGQSVGLSTASVQNVVDDYIENR